MTEKNLMNTREVAQFLDINEKVVYSLISEKGLPATKVTGKWLFPEHLVKQWLENHTVNYPKTMKPDPDSPGVLIITGSNDILLNRTITLFNKRYPEQMAVFGNVGSEGGIDALSRDICHIATSHLLQEDGEEYNFDFIGKKLGSNLPAVVNFCNREQGLLIAKNNPKSIQGITDMARSDIKIANRPPGTGTRLLLDRQIEDAGLKTKEIKGYDSEFRSHLDVGLEIISGRADIAPGIRPVASLLDLDFISIRWERYDLLILKERFFEPGVQLFLGILHEPVFKNLLPDITGYDLGMCGKVIFPYQSGVENV